MLIKKEKLHRLAKSYAVMQQSRTKPITFRLGDSFIEKLNGILEKQIEETVKATVEQAMIRSEANRHRRTLMAHDF